MMILVLSSLQTAIIAQQTGSHPNGLAIAYSHWIFIEYFTGSNQFRAGVASTVVGIATHLNDSRRITSNKADNVSHITSQIAILFGIMAIVTK